jgi:hypothetical protein
MQRQGELSETALLDFANARKYEEMVAVLSALCSVPIDIIAPLMRSDRNDGLLVPCKAAGIKWPTVNAILQNRFAHHTVPDDDLAQAKANYLTLSQANAVRTLRFWQVRMSAGRRSGQDRRSGADTLSNEERGSIGERRSTKDRRSGLDQRSSAAVDTSPMTDGRGKH